MQKFLKFIIFPVFHINRFGAEIQLSSNIRLCGFRFHRGKDPRGGVYFFNDPFLFCRDLLVIHIIATVSSGNCQRVSGLLCLERTGRERQLDSTGGRPIGDHDCSGRLFAFIITGKLNRIDYRLPDRKDRRIFIFEIRHLFGVGSVSIQRVQCLVIGIRDAEALRTVLGIPDAEIVTAAIAVGKRKEEASRPPRKPLDEIVRFY